MREIPIFLLTGLLSAQLPQDPARIQSFEAIPRIAKPGALVELRWSATGTDRVRVEPLNQDFPPVGGTTYICKERTVFWIHASNMRGGQSVPLVVETLQEDVILPPSQTAAVLPVQTPYPEKQQGLIWIQFAALADEEKTEQLRKDVMRLTKGQVTRFIIEDQRHPGRVLYRLRMGPFPSVKDARHRLTGMKPKIASLRLAPIVTMD